MKKLLCALLCAILLSLCLPSAAFADSRYSTVSTTGVALVYPSDSQYLYTPMIAEVKASRANGSIYFMPKPKSGNGNLGTVGNGTEVTILAETNSYYFFETADGRCGWNGKSYFTVLGQAAMEPIDSCYRPCPVSPPYGPGPNDLIGQDGITWPHDSWLADYESMVVCGTVSGNAYLRWSPDNEGREYLRYVSEGEWLIVLARESGYSLVLTIDGRAGWVTSSLLAYWY